MTCLSALMRTTDEEEDEEDEEDEEEDEEDEEDPMIRMDITELLGRLALESPEILRATQAAVPLKRFGALIRSSAGSDIARGDGDDCYDLSFVVERISDFWSHSWHGPVWPKLATLWIHYNSGVGLLGSLCGVVAGATVPYLTSRTLSQASSCLLYSLSGFIGFVIGLVLWDSRRSIFLDKVCISQADASLKAQGIASIGGFLRYSDCMLILWDATYLSRLWCVFELAGFAFLQTYFPTKRIVMRPTFQGAWVLVGMSSVLLFDILYLGFIMASVKYTLWEYVHVTPDFWLRDVGLSTCSFPILWFYTPYVRSVARDAASARKQLKEFSFERAECFCCTNNHRHPDSGDEIPCDRQRVEAAVVSWFGSIEHAEHFLRNRILPNFVVRLGLSYRAALLLNLPSLFASIGLVAWLLPGNVRSDGYCIYGAMDTAWSQLNTICFLRPFATECLILAATYFKDRGSSWIADQVRSLSAAILALLLTLLLTHIDGLVVSLFGCGWRSHLANMTLLATITATVYRQRLWA